MLPLIAIGGAISAVASVVKGVSWLSDKLSSSGASAASSAQASVTGGAGARTSPFEAALAAQAAGQTLPAGRTANASAGNLMLSAAVPPNHGTDYDTLARVQAGIAAYGNVGERHGNHAAGVWPPATDDGRPVMQS